MKKSYHFIMKLKVVRDCHFLSQNHGSKDRVKYTNKSYEDLALGKKRSV